VWSTVDSIRLNLSVAHHVGHHATAILAARLACCLALTAAVNGHTLLLIVGTFTFLCVIYADQY